MRVDMTGNGAARPDSLLLSGLGARLYGAVAVAGLLWLARWIVT